MDSSQASLHSQLAEKYLADLTVDKRQAFADYYELLTERNSQFNLTAVTDINEVYTKHFSDSLATLKLLPDNSKIIDIGCGAGFPSLPLKIANPTLNFTLLDSVNKKIVFINEVIARLNLHNISAFHSRVEDFKTRDFDFALARAVSGLNTLIEYAIPLLKVNGCLLAYKSQKALEEIKTASKAMELLNCKVKDIIEYNIEGADSRNIIVIQKTGSTPKGYPRGKNLPRNKPII